MDLEDLVLCTEELEFSTSEEREKKLRTFYTIFASLNLPQEYEHGFIKVLMPKIHNLLQQDILRKDLILLSFIATQNFNVLDKFLEYEKAFFKLNLHQPSSLYDFCIFKKEHWILEIIRNVSSKEKKFLSASIYNKIIVLKCLDLTVNEFNLAKIMTALETYNEELETDDSLNQFVLELKRCIDIIYFCRSIKPSVDEKEVFNVLCNKNILDTLSIFIHLKDCTNWPMIAQKLKEYDKNISKSELNDLKESEIFELFTIFATIFNIEEIYIRQPNSMNNILDDLKNRLLNIDNPTLLLELLEDVFAILFLTEKHIDDNRPDLFRNNEVVVRTILYLVKGVFDVLKLKNVYVKGTEDHERFTKLSKYVHDAFWRLELVSNVKNNIKLTTPKILCYMLAPPMSLLAMCLRQGNFTRAHQVIEIFNLNDSELAKEVQVTENLRDLRSSCRKFCRIKHMKKIAPNIPLQVNEDSPDTLVKKILETQFVRIEREFEDIVENSTHQNYLCHYKSENEKFMNIMDILCTQSSDLEISKVLLKLAKENCTLAPNIVSPYSKFCENIFNISEKLMTLKNISVCDIISSSDIPFNIRDYERNQEFEGELISLCDQFKAELVRDQEGVLNHNHPSHRTYGKIESLCNNYMKNTGDYSKNINYLEKLYNYLKAFSKVLYIEQNTSGMISKGKNTSFFELLDYNRSELMGQLLFEKHLDPTEFEAYFSRMKLDFLYHLVGNCFPTINLHTEEFVNEEELFPENNLYFPSQNIIQYIMKRNWLLALILKEMYKVPNVQMDISASRIQAFLNYRSLPTTENLRCIFDNNEMITSLQHEISIQKVKRYMDLKISKHDDMFTSQLSTHSNESLETAEEIIEDSLKTTDWKELFDILNSIPEIQMKKSKGLRDLKDMVTCSMINDRFEFECFRYVYHIHNREKRLETIMANLTNWPAEFCLDVIKGELSSFEGPPVTLTEQLEEWQKTIELCENMSKLLNITSWSKCRTNVENDIEGTFRTLVTSYQVDQILLFISRYKPCEEVLKIINEECFMHALAEGCQLSDLHELLNNLPYDQSISICNKLLKHTTNLDQLQFFLNYLIDNTEQNNLKQVQISLKIFSKFSTIEREQFLYLMNNPLDIIEMLLMNTRFDRLTTVLEEIKHDILESDSNEGSISFEKIDQILRTYAEKSLDFRVITQPFPRLLRTPESKLIESIDSSNSEKKTFYMPLEVPSKEEWVQNNEVLECMCCQNIVFSMFNRRHHCRRCGRVICFSCSTKRMQVPTYGDILVRVCKDCYEQTMEESVSSERSETVSAKSGLNDSWLLTNDEEHNKIVREEFSYEHAPSVSLCLSILKYHSHSVEYPTFLLDQCNKILKVLHPSQELLQEIDYLLVIRMLKSLATAAKLMSQQCSFHQGTSSAERILTQAELLGLFSERGCLNLLPVSSNSQVPNIDTAILRRLRDKLLEREQWNLALEVSTKSGMDRTGVFAAWGKSCLKAGCLTKAREKFQRCLDKRRHYESYNESISEFDSTEEGSLSGSNRNLNKSSNELFEKRPLKNPPLLNEIIHILESKTAVIDRNIVDEVNFSGVSASITTLNQSSLIVQRDPSISILNKLRNLNHIATGKYYFPSDRKVQTSYATNRPIVDTVFYNECIFYLSRYGSHQSLLEFYLKHGELDQALQYILDNNMGSELFIEIYMRCLKDGLVNILQENIAKIDSTLDLWKNYLRQLCRHLEKQKLLHSLYQLQLFMGDYMRAAMTCIRFYEENTKNFSDLARKNNFLHKAEEHMKQIHEQEQWIEVAPVRKVSASSVDTFEEKSITNPSLVMKIDNKNITAHLNTIWRQNEVASFLADCEAAGMQPIDTLKYILPEDSDSVNEMNVPTLFGSTMDKARLAILILVTSVEVEQGFKMALRLIQDFKLRPGTVYCQSGKHLAKMQKYEAIIELVQCIKRCSGEDKTLSEICDEMLTLAVATLTKEKAPVARVEDLIKLITDRATKISAYIEAGQLKTAYFFAVRFKRMTDIRRILREAELNNQPNIKALCVKVLQAHSQMPPNSKE